MTYLERMCAGRSLIEFQEMSKCSALSCHGVIGVIGVMDIVVRTSAAEEWSRLLVATDDTPRYELWNQCDSWVAS